MSSLNIPTKGRSSMSQRSRSLSHYFSTSDLAELTDDELFKQVENLKRLKKILTLENEILENTIKRLDPTLLHAVYQAYEYALKVGSGSTSNLNLRNGSFVRSITSKLAISDSPSKSILVIASSRSALVAPSRLSTTTRRGESTKTGVTAGFAPGLRINVLERSELVTIELQGLRQKMEKTQEQANKQHALLRAQLEEIGVRNAAVDKATETYDQEVIIGGYDKIAKRIPAEIWLRYMNDWVYLCDKQIGKLRLRTSTAYAQFSKLKGQITVKAELSESLRPVDFEKIKIENKVLLETIDKKLVQLKLLKSMAGDANLNLAVHKRSMTDQNAYLDKVRGEIAHKKDLTKRKQTEVAKAEVLVEELERKYQEIKKVRMLWEAPDVMEYVGLKYEVSQLTHRIKLLQNKIHIQQIALRSLNKQIQSMSIMILG